MDSNVESRELLYGVTAVRLGLVDRSALIRLLDGWTSKKSQPLNRILVDRGLLSASQSAAVEAEVAHAIQTHGDVRAALAQSGPLADELATHFARSAAFDTIGSPDAFDTIGSPGDGFGTIGDDAGPSTLQAEPLPLPDTSPSRPSGPHLDETEVARREQDDPDATILRAETPPPDEFATQSNDAGEGEFRASGRALGSESDQEAIDRLRYRILRLHAKGGLGQVFVARDEELNRDVALKEIQGRYSGDDVSRMRFMIEAEVTGNLEHPGIVPVYGLGRYPDGRPYYAMRFVRGTSLKEAISQFHQAETAPDRDPGARALELRALLGQLVDVCNAMAYAHSRGVLHRDLKPANIMLGAFGETLVVDWGLAKFKDSVDGPSEGNTGMIRPMSAGSSSQTLFGSAVGTPQYMSPEQAAGRLDQLGPPTDIYSLGAILFTILVGNPPFLDTQLTVLLDKVRAGTFSPPREVNASVPPALDAICRKAMALEPEKRYDSARTLADDIEHWLADEPVSVYREPFLARAARWARRHKTAVAATAALLVTAVVSLGIYSVLIKRERDRTERFYVLARRAVDEMLTQLGADDLANIPQMEPVRARMLREAKAFYDELRVAKANDPRAARDVALATLRLGDIEALLGDKGTLPRYDEAVAKLQTLRKPGDRVSTNDLATALYARGLHYRRLGRYDEASRDLTEAGTLFQDLSTRFPDALSLRRARIDALYQLAAVHDRIGETAKARGEYGEVIESRKAIANGPSGTLDDLRMLGRYTNNLGNLVARVETRDEAGEAKRLYDSALEIQQDVVKRDPDKTPFYRYELAKTHGNLRIVLASDGELEAAKIHALEDVAISSRLVDEFPKVPDYKIKLATALSNLVVLRLDLKQPDQVGKEIDQAISIGRDLVKEHGDRRDYHSILAASLVNRALTKDAPGAEADLLDARQTLIPIATRERPAAEDVLDLGTVHYKLARIHSQQGRVDDALKDLDQAAALHEKAATLGRAGEGLVERAQVLARATDGTIPPLWSDVALQFDLLKNRGEYARCADLCERLPALRPDHAGSYQVAARMLAFLATREPHEPEAQKRALDYATRALKQLRAAASKGLLDATELTSPYYAKVRELLPDAFENFAEFMRKRKSV